jgi:hypothetical protein
MCIWFEVTPLHGNPSEADNAQGLADAIGCNVSELPTISGETLLADECLCDLDIEAFEAKFGYLHEVGDTTFDNCLIEVAK